MNKSILSTQRHVFVIGALTFHRWIAERSTTMGLAAVNGHEPRLGRRACVAKERLSEETLPLADLDLADFQVDAKGQLLFTASSRTPALPTKRDNLNETT